MKLFRVLLGSMLAAFVSFTAIAGEVLYKVSDIPKELKENAHSVVRNEDAIFEIVSVNHGVERITFAITILNKNGLEEANFVQYYDKLRTISRIAGRVFNENGELIKRISAAEINDYSAIAGYSLFEDQRVKYIDPEIRTYPFTVEYTYVIDYNGLFIYPAWFPQHDYNISVEKSSFQVIVSKGLNLRYFEKNLPSPVTKVTGEKADRYSWQVTNLKALVYEPYSPPSREFLPVVLLAPDAFEVAGYPGSMKTWEDMGEWVLTLNEGRNVLPLETVTSLKNMVKGCPDDYNRVKKLYKYMQGRVRYVNLATGLGGWQPIPASDVDRLAYGDCKALTNYMKAMLDAVGIESYYCLVQAGSYPNPIVKDFPSAQFNHAMLCIPSVKDTLWLECTSQHDPCGYIGNFTDDRDVLLVKKGASQLVHTRRYCIDDNVASQYAEATMDETGLGTAIIKSNFKGLKYSEILPIFLSDDVDKKKLISEEIIFPGFQVVNYSFSDKDDIIPSIQESVQVNFNNYLTIIDTKRLITLNFINNMDQVPANVRSRKRDVWVRRPFHEIDTIVYNLPEMFQPEGLPDPVLVDSPYGTYEARVEMKDGQLIYYRDFKLYKGAYSPDSYRDFLDFLIRVSESDQMKCLLTKK